MIINAKDRVTSGKIVGLKPGQILVFGSNDLGIHGAGVAKLAATCGAKYGVGEGLEGFTYGIPTRRVTNRKPFQAEPMTIDEIKRSVNRFIDFAFSDFRDLLVTPIGCGNAGFTPEQIAPLFQNAINIPNVFLPKSFWDVLQPPGYKTDLFGNIM